MDCERQSFAVVAIGLVPGLIFNITDPAVTESLRLVAERIPEGGSAAGH